MNNITSSPLITSTKRSIEDTEINPRSPKQSRIEASEDLQSSKIEGLKKEMLELQGEVQNIKKALQLHVQTSKEEFKRMNNLLTQLISRLPASPAQPLPPSISPIGVNRLLPPLPSPQTAAKLNPMMSTSSTSCHDHCNLATALFKQGKLEEAEKHAKEAISLDPKNSEAYVNLTATLLRQDKLKEAEKSAKELVSLTPKDSFAHRTLAMALLRQGKLEEAEKHAKEAISLDNKDSLAHRILATALLRQGKLEEAEKHAKEAISLDPKDSLAPQLLTKIQNELAKKDNETQIDTSAV